MCQNLNQVNSLSLAYVALTVNLRGLSEIASTRRRTLAAFLLALGEAA